MFSLSFLSRVARFANVHAFLPYRLLCLVLLSAMAMSVQSECFPVSNWSNTDATVLGGDPLEFMKVDSTPQFATAEWYKCQRSGYLVRFPRDPSRWSLVDTGEHRVISTQGRCGYRF